jgi:predicted Zn finger-like uncharacterized protein
MRFACDTCHAQYLISDEKVGPSGVIVRCKKCQNKIVVRRLAVPPPPPPDAADDEPSAAASSAPESFAEPLAPPAAEPPTNGAASLAPAFDEPPASSSAPFAEPPGAASASLEAASFPPPPPSEPASEPGGFDDELGRAFDSVLVRPSGPSEGTEQSAKTDPEGESQGLALAAAGPGLDSEQKTRVVDLAPMASLTMSDAMPEPKNGAATANLEVSAATGGAEWFVAINDAQTGPLTLVGVRAHWDKGELSGDSLVWRSGMPDWRALSSVVELADALAPAPRPSSGLERSEAPAGALATGVQAPAPSALPPPQGDASETEWKPSAAIALESLVRQELDALQKPPEKKPEPPPETAPATARGVVEDVPTAADEPERGLALPSMEEPGSLPAPRRSLPGGETRDPAEESGPRSVGAPLGVPPSRAAVSESRARAPERPRRSGLSGGLIGATIAIVLGVAGFAAYNFLWKPQAATASLAPVQPAPVPSAAPAPPPPSVAPAAAVQPAPGATAPGPSAAAPTPGAQPAATASQPGEPTAQAVASAAAPPTAAAPAEPPRPSPGARRASSETEPGSPPAHGERAPKHPAKGTGAPGAVASKEPEPVIEAPKPKPAGSSIDDEFNRLFGTGGGAAAAAEAPARKERPKSTPYIPPAPGTGAASKETLGQGDIMEVVLANKAAIKKCTESSGSSGTLTMRWTIRPDGATTGVQTMTPDYQKTPLSACLATAIKGFRFPAYSGAPMVPIDFPFKF